MNKDLLTYNLIKISDQLTTEQLLDARENRNWSKFDRSDEITKLRLRLEELEIYSDFIDIDYDPNSARRT
jgi:hypothetical protein